MTLANPAKAYIFDWPARYHNGACGFSFADVSLAKTPSDRRCDGRGGCLGRESA
jgi:hypothetical protein